MLLLPFTGDRVLVSEDEVDCRRNEMQSVLRPHTRKQFHSLHPPLLVEPHLSWISTQIKLSLSDQMHAFFASTYGTEHDGERGSVLEVVTGPDTLARVLGQELQVGSTALESLLHLDLVLHDERFSLGKGVNGLVEHGRDGVVSSL